MRGSTVAGMLLVVFGVVVLAVGLRYPHAKQILDVGDVNATVTEHRPVPNWVGGVAVVGGILLIWSGTGGRRRPAP